MKSHTKIKSPPDNVRHRRSHRHLVRFSVLRSVFTERRSRIEVLKRIGMSRRRIVGMYAWESAAFTVVHTIAGFIAGSAVYLITYLFKCFVLNYEWYGGFTTDPTVLYSTNAFSFTATGGR